MTSICILSLDATRRGGEGVYTAGLAVRLAQRGHRVTVLCQEASDEVQRHCEVKRLAKPKPDRDWGLWRLAAALQVRDYRRQLTTLRLEQSELVIGSAEPLLRAYYQTVTGVPLIYVPHSLVAPLEVASYPTVSSLQRRVLQPRREHKQVRVPVMRHHVVTVPVETDSVRQTDLPAKALQMRSLLAIAHDVQTPVEMFPGTQTAEQEVEILGLDQTTDGQQPQGTADSVTLARRRNGDRDGQDFKSCLHALPVIMPQGVASRFGKTNRKRGLIQ